MIKNLMFAKQLCQMCILSCTLVCDDTFQLCLSTMFLSRGGEEVNEVGEVEVGEVQDEEEFLAALAAS